MEEKQTTIRPSFEEIYMHLAETLAARSTCSRCQVGTVITTTDFRKVLAVGYNGNYTGGPNGCDHPDVAGGCGCIHSEANAFLNCDTPRSVDKYIFVTMLPCLTCAKYAINLGGVKMVFYRQVYRLTHSISLLESAGIQVVHLPQHSKESCCTQYLK